MTGAAYTYIALTSVGGSQVLQSEIAVIAISEADARRKATELFGAGGAGNAAGKTDFRLVRIMDVELLKQQVEQTFRREMPDWLRDDEH